MRRLAATSICWIAACSSGPGPGPDREPVADAMPIRTGITLAFTASAALPADLGDVRIEDVYLNGSVIRAIGDATTQDETSTTRYDHPLHWDRDDSPAGLTFAAAPAGEYAYVEVRIAGPATGSRHDAFEIRGDVRLGGERTDFVIRAGGPSVVATVPAQRRLEAGRALELALELDLARLVAEVPWGDLPERDDRLRLDETTPEALAAFRARLAGAFRLR